MRSARIVVALVLLVVAGAVAYWWMTADEVGPRGFQGYVEGNLVYMAPEEGGRIDKMQVEAGDDAKEGQLLFGLESAMQIGQRNEAEARLRQAEAQLANLKAAQQRPEQIAVLRAQEERAKAQLQFSKNEYSVSRCYSSAALRPRRSSITPRQRSTVTRLPLTRRSALYLRGGLQHMPKVLCRMAAANVVRMNYTIK